MRPLDPTLLRTTRAARGWVVTSVLLQTVLAVLIVAQTWVLAALLSPLVEPVLGHPFDENERRTAFGAWLTTSHRHALAWLAIVVTARILVTWCHQYLAHSAAQRTIAQLRLAVIDSIHEPAGADTATLATVGLNDLAPYLTKYLPQLFATAIITPALLVVVWWYDTTSFVLLLCTVPLVPLLMALVGWTTQRLTATRLERMKTLGGQVVDLLQGLPTLIALGRAGAQTQRLRTLGHAYATSTLKVLQQAFMSSLVLEVFTTLSVAVVAVGVGLRLLHNNLDLHTSLMVLVLAPEVFLPLRLVGQYFHASSTGVQAVNQAMTLITKDERVGQPHGADSAEGAWPGGAVAALEWQDVSIQRRENDTPAPRDVCGIARSGEVTVLSGPNGSGKSTLVEATLGLLPVTHGNIRIHLEPPQGVPQRMAVPAAEGPARQQWHSMLAWCPQRSAFFPGTVADNIRTGDAVVSDQELTTLLESLGLVMQGPEAAFTLDTMLGRDASGLSAGQRQRLALVRTLAAVHGRRGVLSLWDEPTAHLDADTEARVIQTLREHASQGNVVVMVSHRPAVLAAADRVIEVNR